MTDIGLIWPIHDPILGNVYYLIDVVNQLFIFYLDKQQLKTKKGRVVNNLTEITDVTSNIHDYFKNALKSIFFLKDTKEIKITPGETKLLILNFEQAKYFYNFSLS